MVDAPHHGGSAVKDETLFRRPKPLAFLSGTELAHEAHMRCERLLASPDSFLRIVGVGMLLDEHLPTVTPEGAEEVRRRVGLWLKLMPKRTQQEFERIVVREAKRQLATLRATDPSALDAVERGRVRCERLLLADAARLLLRAKRPRIEVELGELDTLIPKTDD
ncbi:MAG: hypothetical protein AAB668_03565 [Patescibacteria group bacterium]